jgi:hypothetical protein
MFRTGMQRPMICAESNRRRTSSKLSSLRYTGISRKIMLGTVLLTLAVVPAAGASTGRGTHKNPAKCAPRRQVLFADAQAQVYYAREEDFFNIRACEYGQRGSVFVATCNREEGVVTCARGANITLAGSIVAYEYAISSYNKYLFEEKPFNKWYVEVQDLRTGHVLHKVPTGAALKPEPRSIGTGSVVKLVLKSNGSVAWIANDGQRTGSEPPPEVPYLNVYALDKTGIRLLAAGNGIDPASLALSDGGVNASLTGRPVAGSTLYWTQGGKAFSSSLN